MNGIYYNFNFVFLKTNKMTGSSTFQIFPRTTIEGDTITDITPDGVVNDICTGQCKCLCETTNDCVAFTIDKATGQNCRLKSNFAITKSNISQDAYIKGARGSYIIFWVFLFLIAFGIFIAASRTWNVNSTSPYYQEGFA